MKLSHKFRTKEKKYLMDFYSETFSSKQKRKNLIISKNGMQKFSASKEKKSN